MLETAKSVQMTEDLVRKKHHQSNHIHNVHRDSSVVMNPFVPGK